MLQHIVLFKFKPETSAQEIERIVASFAALPTQIDTLQNFHWGENNSPEGKSHGFTHAFVMSFASEAERDAYLPHPAHRAFGEGLRGHIEDVLVFDFWAQQ